MVGRSLKGFFRYSEDIEPLIFEFQREEYPDRDESAIPERWRWTFLRSARRLDVAPMVWLYCREGKVVAHQGAIPVLLKAGGERLVTGWFVETMAAAAIRGKAIGPMLVQKAREDLPLNLSLGQTAEMRELQHALGWQTVGELPEYVFVTSSGIDLSSKFPRLLSRLGAHALAWWHSIRLSRQSAELRRHYSVLTVERFNEEHDALWASMEESCCCTVVRDASYLNWKYIDRPKADFRIFELREHGRLAGTAVVVVRNGGMPGAYPRGFILDVIADLKNARTLRALIAQCVIECRDLGAQSVTVGASQPSLADALSDFGFIRRSGRYRFLVSLDIDGDSRETLLQRSNWHLSYGDSDAAEFIS